MKVLVQLINVTWTVFIIIIIIIIIIIFTFYEL